MLADDQILWDVVEEHLDEAEFLVEQWRSARASPLYTLDELREGPELRMMAHIDGLIVNGPIALQRVAWPVLEEDDDPHRVAAAALAVLDSGDFRVLELLDEPDPPPEPDDLGDPEPDDPDDGFPEEVLDLEHLPAPASDDDRLAAIADLDARLAAMDPDDASRSPLLDLRALLDASAPDDAGDTDGPGDTGPEPTSPEEPASGRADGLALAMGLCSHAKVGEHVRHHVTKARGPSLALLLDVCAARGLEPGPALDRALVDDDPRVRAAALRAAVFGDRRRLLAVVEANLSHPHAAVRAAALDTALAWGSRAAWELTMQVYLQPGARAAMTWMASLGDDRHAEALVKMLDDPSRRHDALWALGFSGRVAAIEACLLWLDDDDETTRRLAGEALAHMLGLPLDEDELWEELATDEPAAGLEGDTPDDDDDDLDADLAPRPEDDLPLPDGDAIRRRWERIRGGFASGGRYLLGEPIGREGPGWLLERLPCRRVDVVAREVVARSQGVGRWPGGGPSSRHRQAASALAALGRSAGAIQGDRR